MSNAHPSEPSPPDDQFKINEKDEINSNSFFKFIQPSEKLDSGVEKQEEATQHLKERNQFSNLNDNPQSKSEPQSDPMTLAGDDDLGAGRGHSIPLTDAPSGLSAGKEDVIELQNSITDNSNSKLETNTFNDEENSKTKSISTEGEGLNGNGNGNGNGIGEKIEKDGNGNGTGNVDKDSNKRDSRIQFETLNTLSKNESKSNKKKNLNSNSTDQKVSNDSSDSPSSSSSTSSTTFSTQSIYLPEDDREITFHFYCRWVPKTFIRFTCKPIDDEESIFKKGNEKKRVKVGVKTRYEPIQLVSLKTSTFSSPLPSSIVFPLSMKVPFSTSTESLTKNQLKISDLVANSQKMRSLFNNNDSNDEKEKDLTSSLKEEEEGEEMISKIKTINYRSLNLILHPTSGKLLLLSDWRDPSWTSFASVQNGLSNSQVELRRTLFGENLIDVIGASTLQILIVEATHPFYIFSLLSIALWSYDTYQWYALVIGVISIAGITATTVTTKQSANRMRKMSRFVCKVRVKRDGKWQVVDSNSLVPGDIIDSLSDGSEVEGESSALNALPCDCILLEGDAIVNESMLTGESVPVVKSAANAKIMRNVLCNGEDLKGMEKHFLSGGTKLIRVRPGETDLSPSGNEIHQESTEVESPAARSLVVKTGFNTTKGSLIRSMLFPKPVDTKFYADAFKFIMILFVIAVVGFIGALIYFLKIGVDSVEIALRALDLFTIVVPPALPAAMSVCITFSIARLKKKQIYCTSPQRINVAGKIGVVVFDKTGTLTLEGLDVLGVRHSKGKCQNFSPLWNTIEELREDDGPSSSSSSDENGLEESDLSLINALGCTHDLNLLNGELIGEPLEVSMIEWSKFELEEHPLKVKLFRNEVLEGDARNVDGGNATVSIVKSALTGDRFAIIKKFDFVASLRRMSVIIKPEESLDSLIYVKGAPESLSGIIDSNTLPDDFQTILDSITHAGYRVLALAGKRMKDLSWDEAQRMTRSSAESQLNFLGLLIFENPLKPTSAPTILTLQDDAQIPTKLCTGDAILTAISCAKEVEMIRPHSAPVYVPRLRDSNLKDEKNDVNELQVEWVNVNDVRKCLDPYTLDPIDLESKQQNIKLKDIGLAVTGETFRFLMNHSSKETWERILVHCQVFARMAPEQKGELVSQLHSLGFTVAFCGDGANDIEALNAADVGLSLSEAEASVAAPFTSKEDSIECVEYLMREGRSTLETSRAMFQFMAIYSICEYFSVLLLYGQATSFDNGEYLYIDVFIVLPVAFGLANSWPSSKLSSNPPPSRLMCRKVVLSLLGQMVLLILSQTTVYVLLHKQSFYIPPELDPENLTLNDQDNTAVFLSSLFSYMIAATVFSLGPPHRKPLYFNFILFPAVVVLSALSIYFTFMTSGPLFSVFGFVPLTLNFQAIIFGVALVQICLAIFYEFYLVNHLVRFFLKPVQAFRRRKMKGKVDESGNPMEAQVEKRWRTVLRNIQSDR